ncbi:DNA-formamidopyrimidine glycosylase family protein [Timonella sp. A28]|uniref:DNA-formamidopyrimidine glycosylase family protein n=1 Tax=Timonella sp. A28 TaxID=3442640 RepID=UPI003EBD6312
MPEGDTVLTAANTLHEIFAGSVLTRGDLNWPSAPAHGLQGHHLDEVDAYGKHLLMRFDQGLTLRTHLRMDGSWRIVRTDSSEARSPSPFVRAAIGTAQWTALGYRLGMLDVWQTREEPQHLEHLGPDILSDSFVPTPFLERAHNDPHLRVAPRASRDSSHQNGFTLSDEGWRTGIERFAYQPATRPIGETLLDQTVVAGIGTIYMAEGLFELKYSPLTPLADVHVPRLLAAIRSHMIRAVVAYPQGRKIHVHGRTDKPCHVCGSPIERLLIGPPLKQRPAFYCATCQTL